MPQLNPISPKKLIKILLKVDFREIRINWSHHFFDRKDWKTTVVPVHWNEDITVWLLKKILRDTNISVEEFEKLRLE